MDNEDDQSGQVAPLPSGFENMLMEATLKEPKPGVKTSEFWLTIVVTLVGLFVTLGMITQDQADQALAIAAVLMPGVVAIGFYIWSRAKVKTGG